MTLGQIGKILGQAVVIVTAIAAAITAATEKPKK